MELGIIRDDEGIHHARVKRRAVDQDGQPIGRPSNNPLLEIRRYEVEYLDGTTEVLTANIIAENLLAQVDDQGHRHLMIDEIEDHRKNSGRDDEGLHHARVKRRVVDQDGQPIGRPSNNPLLDSKRSN